MVLLWFPKVFPAYSCGLPKTQRRTVTDGSLTETDGKTQKLTVTDGVVRGPERRWILGLCRGWCAGVPVCRCAGVQVCRCAGVPVVYQYNGVPMLLLISL